jgi:hypothetical protein
LQRLAECTRGLEPLEEHGIPGIRQAALQMMHHASAGCHAARRYDNDGIADRVEGLGIGHGAVEVDAGRPKRPDPLSFELVHFEIVVLVMVPVQIRAVDRHRAVHVNRNGLEAPTLDEFAQDVEQLLRATYGEGRNHHAAATRGRARYDLGQPLPIVVRRV